MSNSGKNAAKKRTNRRIMLCFIIAVLCGPFGAAMLGNTIYDFQLLQHKQDYIHYGTFTIQNTKTSLWDRRRGQKNKTVWISHESELLPLNRKRLSFSQNNYLQKRGIINCSLFARRDGDKFQYVTEDKLTKLSNFSVALTLLLTLTFWSIFFYCLRWIFITSQTRNADEKRVGNHPG